MNELETQNLHEYAIRQSVVILVLKGGTAWIILTIISFGLDRLPDILFNLTKLAIFNFAIPSETLALLHLFLNILLGWLILSIVLGWFFEYYIIKPDCIIVRKGIVFSHEDVFQIEDVKTIDIYQGLWGKIFRTGTLKFFAYRAQKMVCLNSIDNPHAIAALINSLHPVPEITKR